MSGGSLRGTGLAFSAAPIDHIGWFQERARDRRRWFGCFALLVAVFTCPLSVAAVLRAGPGCAFPTPQLAFAAAVNGDTVRIRSGNYPGPFVIAKAIRVEGGYSDCSTTARSGRSDFHGNAPAQSVDSLLRIPALVGQVVLDRITLRDNIRSSGDGGGLHVTSAVLALSDVEIRNNRAVAGGGGGIYLDNASVELVADASVLIERNRADVGGGIAANGSQARILFDLGAVGAAAVLRNNRVNTNSGSGPGSAIYLFNGGDAGLVDTLIEVDNNEPFGARSAIEIADSTAISGLTLRNSNLLSHAAAVASKYSAIIAAPAGNARIEISDSVIDGWRSGLVLRDGSARIDRVIFSHNVGGSFGGGVRLLGNAVLEAHSVDFIGNSATSGGGALMALDNASWALFGAPGLPTRFIGNGSDLGGAIYHESSGIGNINDSATDWGPVEFDGNAANSGGAIFYRSPAATPLVLRSPLTFTGSSATLHGGAIYLHSGRLDLDARLGEQIALSGNRATNGDGGAIFRGGGQLWINRSAGEHGNVVLSDNAAGNGNQGGHGGSIASFGAGELRIQAPVQFLGPTALGRTANYGGHIYAIGAGDPSAIVELQGWVGSGRGILIAGGYAEFDGGGMYLSGVAATLDWVQFGTPDQPNRVFAGEGTHLTAYLSGTDVKLRNCSLRHGHSITGSDNHGLLVDVGAIVRMESVFGVAGTPPAIGAAWPCEAAILGYEAHCSDISDNGNLNQFGQGSIGGGVSIGNAAQLILNGVSIDRNLGAPGAIEVESGGSLIAKNVRVSDNSSGVRLAGTAQMVAEHLTVAGNTGIAFELADAPGTTLDLVRSIVWGNATGIVKGAQAVISADCNISQTAAFGTSSDPGFVDSDRGRYRIGNGAALDHCPGSSASEDLDGSPRPQGSDYDAGALEGLSLPRPTLLFFDGFE